MFFEKLISGALMVLLMICSATVYAESGGKDSEKNPDIKGRVVDQEGNPVVFANVSLVGTVKGTTTDINGKFELFGIPSGSYELRISSIGFKSLIQAVEAPALDLEINFEQSAMQMPEMQVISNKDRIFSKVPGSVGYIDSKEIQMIQPVSGNEVLRRVPGLNVVDEEGLGMRVNIGIRGLDPDRSRSVLILEDGIPVALAPYGEPEMYYTPPIDRMSGIEVLKGSGQILFGPQTIGGVVNFITANPPEEETITLRAQGGQGGFFSGLVGYGNTFGNTGIQANLLRKTADQVGITDFEITDFNTKFLFNISERSNLGVKASVYNEVSNSTYIGLTQTMYDAGGQDFTHMAPDDELNVRRYSLSFNHEYQISDKVRLNTLVYGFTTTRNWRRQDFGDNSAGNNPPGNWTGVTWGDESIPGGAIYMRNSTGNRNRQFEVVGVEPRLKVDHGLFGVRNELQAGVRYLYERAFEQRVNGTKFNASSGNLIEDEIRTGYAFSAYAQNQTYLSSKISLSYGLRFESFDYERDIARRRFGGVVTDTILVRESGLSEIIPGLGFNYRPNSKVNLFGGVHKGFAPPRTKDAISEVGEVYELEAESSWNFEAGVRTDLVPGVFLELTGFYMNFSNQVIPVAESSGGIGFGEVNGGATIHRGFETAVVVDLARILNLQRVALNYDVNFTFVDARFNNDRFKDEVNIKGNKTPYAPNYLVNSTLTFETDWGLGVRFSGNYVGEQFGDELNTVIPSPNGRIGLIPSYMVFDGMISYQVKPWNTRFNIALKNITDERYIATRRPLGIRVGIPRLFTAGVEIRL